jgi:hypothetical protein
LTIKVKHKRGTASAITAANPTLAAGELAFETDTRRFKLGDGTTAWTSLAYVTPYVSATDRLLGRSSAGAGVVEEITCTATGRSLIGSADAAAARTVLSVQPTASPAFTGAATVTNTGNVVPLTVTNTGTANSFVVNDESGDTTPFVIDSSGNVGIGTSSLDPSTKLNVAGAYPSSGTVTRAIMCNGTVPSGSTVFGDGIVSFLATAAASFTCANLRHFVATQATLGAGSSVTNQFGYVVESTLTGATNNYGFYSNIGSGAGRYNFYAAGTAENYFAGVVTLGGGSASAPILTSTVGTSDTGLWFPAADVVAVSTAGAERLRVDAGGRVGIGVTPSVSGSAAFQVRGDIDINGNDANRSITYNVGVGDAGITGWYRAKIAFVPSGATNNISQHIAFFNKDGDLGGSTLTERMRITSDGEVWIGYTTDNGAYKLQVNSQIYATNATVATSDARFKTRVETLTDATAIVEALRPVAFDFIPQAERNFSTDRQIGLIAQETQAALAGCDYAASVVAQCGDHLGLAYEKLVPLLIKALQESNARIAALEEKVNA